VRLVLLREMCREESRERLSQDLRRGISEDAFGTLVEDGNAMRLIDGDDAVLGDFENTRETRVRETLGQLRVLALRDVAGDAQHACGHPIARKQLRADFQGHTPSLLGDNLYFEGRRYFTVQFPREHLPGEREIFGRHDVIDVGAWGFIPAVAADPLPGAVHRREEALQVGCVDHVVRTLEQLAIALVATSERLLRCLMLPDPIAQHIVGLL